MKNLSSIINRRIRDKDVWIILFIPIFIFSILSLIVGSRIIGRNIWYYSLSTIVQSMAAVMAIGGSFFTFKMLGVNKEINDYRERIISLLSLVRGVKKSNFYRLSNDELMAQFMEERNKFKPNSNLVDLFRYFEGRTLRGEIQNEVLDNWKQLINDYIEIKNDTLGFLKEATKITSATIIISIILLSGSNIFYNAGSYLYLSISTLLFIVSIYYISTKIIKIVS